MPRRRQTPPNDWLAEFERQRQADTPASVQATAPAPAAATAAPQAPDDWLAEFERQRTGSTASAPSARSAGSSGRPGLLARALAGVQEAVAPAVERGREGTRVRQEAVERFGQGGRVGQALHDFWYQPELREAHEQRLAQSPDETVADRTRRAKAYAAEWRRRNITPGRVGGRSIEITPIEEIAPEDRSLLEEYLAGFEAGRRAAIRGTGITLETLGAKGIGQEFQRAGEPHENLVPSDREGRPYLSGLASELAFDLGSGVSSTIPSLLGGAVGGAVGGPAGAIVGATAPAGGMIFGGLKEELEEEGVDPQTATRAAATVAPLGAALEAIVPIRVARRLGRAGVDPLVGGVARRAARGFVEEGLGEALTEGAQTVLERGTVAALTDQDFFSRETAEEIFRGARTGALTGGLLGGASSVVGGIGPRSNAADAYLAELGRLNEKYGRRLEDMTPDDVRQLITPREARQLDALAQEAAAADVGAEEAATAVEPIRESTREPGPGRIARFRRRVAERVSPELAREATTDPLTGAMNRGADERATTEALRDRAPGTRTVRYRIDLDNFKALNDTRGHAAGDEALRVVTQAIRQQLRPDDVVSLGRPGGDEFAITMRIADDADPAVIRDRLEAAVDEALERAELADVGDRRVGASIGYAEATEGMTASALDEAADAAAIARKAERGVSQPREVAAATDTPAETPRGNLADLRARVDEVHQEDPNTPPQFRILRPGEPVRLFRGMSTEADASGARLRETAEGVEFYSQAPDIAERYAQRFLDRDRYTASEGERVAYDESVAPAAPHVLEVEHVPQNILDLTGDAEVPAWAAEILRRIDPASGWIIDRPVSDRSGLERLNLKKIQRNRELFDAAREHGIDTIVFRDYTAGRDLSVVPLLPTRPIRRYDVDLRQQWEDGSARTLTREAPGTPVTVESTTAEAAAPEAEASSVAPAVRQDVRPTDATDRPTVEPEAARPQDAGDVGLFPVSDIQADPRRFQYKADVDADTGAGRELRDIQTFDPNLAGVIQVWRDPADGQVYVVNGHHRLELAKRLGEDDILVRFIEASDASEAREIGAMTNIAEGRGTAIDAAKIFRDSNATPEDLERRGISLRGAVARDGLALANLPQSIFDDVVAQRISVPRAAIIGGSGLSEAQQLSLARLLEQRERGRRRLTNEEATELVRFVRDAGQTEVETTDLFGTQVLEQSLALEKAELSAYVKKQLAQDRRLFGYVGRGQRAQAIEGQGAGRIDVGRAQQVAEQAAMAEEVYNRLSTMAGPVSDALNDAARRLADGEKAAQVKRDLYAKVREAIGTEIETLGIGSTREPSRTRSSVAALSPDPDQLGMFGEREMQPEPVQGELLPEGPRLDSPRLSEAEQGARQIVSLLEGKVQRGQASRAEVERYEAARKLLARDEAMGAEEVAAEARREGGRRTEDPGTGELFGQEAEPQERPRIGEQRPTEQPDASPPEATPEAATEPAADADLPIRVVPDDIPYDRAFDAHRGTSMVPEQRARQVQESYVEHMRDVHGRLAPLARTDAQRQRLAAELERYRDGYIRRELDRLAAASRTLSPMVAGPSNFPVRRNRKALDAEARKTREFIEWQERAQAAMRRNIQREGAADVDPIDALRTELAQAEAMQERMRQANTVIRRRNLTDEQRREQLREVGLSDRLIDAALQPDEAGRTGFPAYMLRNNNARIKRLRDRLAQAERNESRAGGETEFDGGTIIENTDADRLQIVFDEAPSAEMREQLKARGFRWSRREGAWQRQLTDNARYAASSILGVDLGGEAPARPRIGERGTRALVPPDETVAEAGQPRVGEPDAAQSTIDATQHSWSAYYLARFPEAGAELDGLKVRGGPIPNTASIDGYYSDHDTMRGVRAVRLDEIESDYHRRAQVSRLAREIEANGEITPIIVGVNPEDGSLTVIEGQHRVAALRELGKEQVPALVVVGVDGEGGDAHYNLVAQAVASGVDVPANVLADYDDLRTHASSEPNAPSARPRIGERSTREAAPARERRLAPEEQAEDFSSPLQPGWSDLMARALAEGQRSPRPRRLASERLPDAGRFRRGTAQEAPRPSEILENLREGLNIKIGVGRFGGGRFLSRALGIYKPKPRSIRLGVYGDIATLGHEIGHDMHQLFFGTVDGHLTEDQLAMRPWTPELETMARGISDESLAEGWAEYWRRYIDNPDVLPVRAPKLHEYVQQRLDAEFPAFKTVLEKAQRDWSLYREASARARLAAKVSTGEKPRNLSVRDNWRRLRTDVLDDFEPLRHVVEQLTGTDRPADIREDAATLARLVRGAAGTAEVFLEHGTLDFRTLKRTGKSLREVLEPVKGNLDDFRDYIVARRAQELHGRDIETGIRPEDADAVVRDVHASELGDRFRQAFDDLQVYNRAMLQYLVDAGVMSAETMRKILENNQAYVPFYRVMEDRPAKGGRFSLGFGHLFSPVKRIKGSGRDIIDPLESIIKNTYSYVHLAARQQVSNSLALLAEREGAARFIERIPTPMVPQTFRAGEISRQLEDLLGKDVLGELRRQTKRNFEAATEGMSEAEIREAGLQPTDPGDELLMFFRPGDYFGQPNVISVLENGKRAWYEVDPDLYAALEGLDRESAGAITRLLSVPARTLRAGAVLAPEFQLRNPIRDQMMAFIQSEYGFKPGIDFGRGLFSLLRRDEHYWRWRAAGGENAALVSMDRRAMRQNVQRLIGEGGVSNVLKDPLDVLRAVSQLMEDATRLGEFRLATQAEGTAKAGLQRSASAAREISVDFARHGAKTAALRQVAAFWNARIQGYDRLARALKRDPTKVLARSVAGITLPSVLLYFVNRDDPEYWEIPQWQRDLFWHVKIRGQWVRIPKPFEAGMVFGTIPERILEWIDSDDPEGLTTAVSEFLKGEAMDTFLPWPNAIQPLVENAVNYSFFLDRPIVPRSMQQVEPRFQSTDRTSEVAKLFGRWTDTSPMKIDNLMRAWTGGLGTLASQTVDTGVSLARDPVGTLDKLRDVQPEDIPGVRGVTSRPPGLSSESVERFYRRFEEAESVASTARFLEREERWEELEAYLDDEERQRLLADLPGLRRTADTLAKLRATAQIIERDPDTPAAEKRREVEELGREAWQTARAAIERRTPAERNQQD